MDRKFSVLTMVTGILICLLTMSSCVKPYVGKRVNTYTPAWRSVDEFPKTYRIQDKCFVFEFTIDRGELENEYVITGTTDGSSGSVKSFDNLMPARCSFAFLIASRGLVIDYLNFMPRGTRLSSKLPFNRKFISEPFDSIAITWKAAVRG